MHTYVCVYACLCMFMCLLEKELLQMGQVKVSYLPHNSYVIFCVLMAVFVFLYTFVFVCLYLCAWVFVHVFAWREFL